MDRRDFVKGASALALSSQASRVAAVPLLMRRLRAAESSGQPGQDIPNWADQTYKPQAAASSYFIDPPWGYLPANVYNPDEHIGWEADIQMEGAWLEIAFPQPRPVKELWILGKPLPRDVVGADPYLATHSRTDFYAPPRRIRCSAAGGQTTEELRDSKNYQIVQFSTEQDAASIRILIETAWARPGAKETGLGKVKVFPRSHPPGFEIDIHAMYDDRNGNAEQTATIEIVNPGDHVDGARLVVSQGQKVLREMALAPIPMRSVSRQPIWIPALFEDAEMTFAIKTGAGTFGAARTLHVPSYRSFFDGGVFALNCPCHNDLGWLDTQSKTADFRSEKIILPALALLDEYPAFRYSIESTAYLMEFLERHPEKREQLHELMRQGRFSCGASYVQCQEVHVGPEKLVRQFYYGRRWLRDNFPGVDSQIYYKTDPPALTMQMPQILKKAGIKYLIQGRMPFGFYRWASPDGSIVFAYGLTATSLVDPLDPVTNEGWLKFSEQRQDYYAAHDIPPQFIYDYWFDYFIPQPELPSYVHEQNEAMQRFAAVWNAHFASDPSRQIHPPQMAFTTLEEFFNGLTRRPLNIPTLKGDWPLNWAYYDEPGHREGLIAGRLAHNRLLMAERLFAGLSLTQGIAAYPQHAFTDAWMTNCWPDHGWGGNRGIETDAVFVNAYEKSLSMADDILAQAGRKLCEITARPSPHRLSVVVFNPLSWERSDVTEARFSKPALWRGFTLKDDSGSAVPFELIGGNDHENDYRIAFVAERVPSVGYRTFYLEHGEPSPQPVNLSGSTIENDFFDLSFGPGGIHRLHHKRLNWEVFNTDKFDAAEVLQFNALGFAWDDPEIVATQDFDKTSNHSFTFRSFSKTPLRTMAVREAAFRHFTLRQSVFLYERLARVDITIELIDWDGQKERELRVVFPINVEHAHLNYEVPFGTVEFGRDELNVSLLPTDTYRNFDRNPYGAEWILPFREAINWIDASDNNYLGRGCLLASDMTVHLFNDQSDDPSRFPLLQHVLLSTRKSQAWNPENWFTQEGTHVYRMSILPHADDWRARYHEAIGFNFPLLSFASPVSGSQAGGLPDSGRFFALQPSNLVLTALKKAENSEQLVARFYEAEGFACEASLRFAKPVKRARRAKLIEDDEEPLAIDPEGAVHISVGPWEIVTVKIAL